MHFFICCFLVLFCTRDALLVEAHVRQFEQSQLRHESSGNDYSEEYVNYQDYENSNNSSSYSTTGKPMPWLRSSNYHSAIDLNASQRYLLQSRTVVQKEITTPTPTWTTAPSLQWHLSGDRNNNSHSNATDSHGKPSSLYCEPEIFAHDYIIAVNRSEAATNSWKRAKVGERAGLHSVCLKPNGLPLTRSCRYNAWLQRAEWEDISQWPRIACIRQPRECILSNKLNTLHEQLLSDAQLNRTTHDRNVVTTQLYGMLRETNYRLLPADVHFTGQILREITSDTQDVALAEDVVSICDRMMSTNTRVLRISADLNATNSLLETFESYMDGVSTAQVPTYQCSSTTSSSLTATPVTPDVNGVRRSYNHGVVETVRLGHLGVVAQLSANVSVFYVNPYCANISGIVIYAPATDNRGIAGHKIFHANLAQFRYRFVYMNESVEALMLEPELEVASFVPTRLWRSVSAHLQLQQREAILVLKLYAHDVLFVETTLVQTRKPFSKVLSISIPGYDGTFAEELPFLLRNKYAQINASQAHNVGTGCGYWNYNTWVSAGVHTDASNVLNQPVIRCGTQHLTQFSFLLGGSYRQNDVSNDILITPLHMHVLDIISLVGCSLSLLGMLGIFLTAVLCKSWRALASTKVLLNLCLALTLQMFLFVFVNTDDMSEHLVENKIYADCVALGAALQYSVLVLFMWMLIVAVLQFQRYVTIIGIERPRHYILKAAILAWGLPLLPTLLVVFIDPASYIPTDYQLQTDSGLCYPSGLSLTLGVVMPVTVIVVVNLTIFMYVFYSISHSLNQAQHRYERQMVVKQVRLSVLLFFLLGISWIFGIFAYMGGSTVFSYLFCLTATLQGFLLFVYFVLLDEMTRNAWLQLFCPKRKQQSSKRSTELQSMTTTSTGLESGSGVGAGAAASLTRHTLTHQQNGVHN